MLIMVFMFAVFGCIPIDIASLFFALVQTLITVATVLNSEEVNVMARRIWLVSGTHGAVD